MNPLFAPLPRSVRIRGTEYPIRPDAQTALRILCAFEDDSLADFEKQAVMLTLFYPELPPDTDEAARLAVLFLNCGEEAPEQNEPRLYSFTHDAPLIYAAMRRSHGVDAAEPMHWYLFHALFFDVSADTLFAQIVYLRRQKLRGKLTPDERRTLAALGEIAELPQHTAPEERQAAAQFCAELNAGKPFQGGCHVH